MSQDLIIEWKEDYDNRSNKNAVLEELRSWKGIESVTEVE